MLSKFEKSFRFISGIIENLYSPVVLLKGAKRPDTAREEELESALTNLYEYVKTLEGYYAVWHLTRPQIAPMPDNAEEVGKQVRKALRIDN